MQKENICIFWILMIISKKMHLQKCIVRQMEMEQMSVFAEGKIILKMLERKCYLKAF